MAVKIPLLVGVAVGTASLLTWGGFKAHKNQKYNKRMWEYEQLRNEFFAKDDLTIKELMCENNSPEDCKEGKAYLPKPYENEDWEKAYEDLEKNRKSGIVKSNFKIPGINNPSDLKDYCYEAIKKDLLDANNPNYESFNPSGDTSHDLCVLIPYPRKK